MFGLFKKKSEVEKLQLKYKKLLEEAHRLSTSNRSASDQKMFEANELLKEIDQLKASKENS
ncbi:Lacal_2735 family protein [Christiangramia sabulilitoris]|uniref:Lacal_2735 family protein n=2 Tax=Christiangramia sabulilitoris TaxID=2583991 RepID=A0A550I0R2_9FLAO|nr:Lacal_2735 family protein [Christiangramia sabulilitoris]TRO64564.1 Lacal_2735 family protein [Christiangramia sabulilitoris]